MKDIFMKNYLLLSEPQKQDIDFIKKKAQELLEMIEVTKAYSDPRMITIAKTNLEQAVIWAVKGVTNPL